MPYAAYPAPWSRWNDGAAPDQRSSGGTEPGETRALSLLSMKRGQVDFHAIPDRQSGIHERLLNWARWCFSGQVPACAPMFSGYRSNEVWAAPEASTPVDKLDAQKIEKSVCALPYTHKHAIRWWYIAPIGPAKTAHILGLTLEGLAMTVIEARDRVLTHAQNPVSVYPTREPGA